MNPVSRLGVEVLPVGIDGYLVRFSLTADPEAMTAARRFAALLEADAPAGVLEIAAALVSVFVRFDAAIVGRGNLKLTLETKAKTTIKGPLDMPPATRRWKLPVAFGEQHGPQLADVATALGVSEQEAVSQICNADLRVLTIGFAPGQPYIGLMPEPWNLPRMSQLNPAAPAGALVVAVRQFVLFGADSATGWQQVGLAAFRTFVPDRAEPMPLRGGDAIRFVRAPADEILSLTKDTARMGGAVLEVLG